MIDELKQWEYDRGYEKGKADVLDKIRNEIEEIVSEETKHDEKWARGLHYALSIIDKYRKEQE